MKIKSKDIMLVTMLAITSASSGCALLGPLLGGLMLTGEQNSGMFVSHQDSALSNTSYRVTTNPVQQDGKSLYGYYEEKSGH